MVVLTCNPSTQKARAEGSQVQVQRGPLREPLSQKNKTTTTKNFYLKTN
jgi:hypothetical protein